MTHKAILSLLAALAVSTAAPAQQAVELTQQKMSKWDIGTANYSGIAPIGNSQYVLVSDKEPTDGFFVFTIIQDPTTGECPRSTPKA